MLFETFIALEQIVQSSDITSEEIIYGSERVQNHLFEHRSTAVIMLPQSSADRKFVGCFVVAIAFGFAAVHCLFSHIYILIHVLIDLIKCA
jgi:hypothetical protein